jgi:type IV pilus assembly protein PilV
MKHSRTNRPGRRQGRHSTGFGMVEVLVTLVLLSVGLMGIAKLQLVSLRSVHASTVRGQAVLLAYDLADRMRANRFGVVDLDGVEVGLYNGADNATYQLPALNGCTEGAGATADCTVAEVAAHDMQEWKDSIATLLPNGKGWVCVDSDPTDDVFDASIADVDPRPAPACDNVRSTDPVNGPIVYSINVIWTDVEDNGPATKRYNMRFQL